MWREGPMGFWAYILCFSSLLQTRHYLGRSYRLLAEPIFSFLGLWPSWPLLLPCHSTVPSIALSSFCFMFYHGLVVNTLSCKFSAQGFSGLPFTSSPLLGFVGQHSYCTNPFHYVILRASPAHLLRLYLYYSHGLFAKSFGLPQSNYHIFTSHYYLDLLGFRPAY